MLVEMLRELEDAASQENKVTLVSLTVPLCLSICHNSRAFPATQAAAYR